MSDETFFLLRVGIFIILFLLHCFDVYFDNKPLPIRLFMFIVSSIIAYLFFTEIMDKGEDEAVDDAEDDD